MAVRRSKENDEDGADREWSEDVHYPSSEGEGVVEISHVFSTPIHPLALGAGLPPAPVLLPSCLLELLLLVFRAVAEDMTHLHGSEERLSRGDVSRVGPQGVHEGEAGAGAGTLRV